MGSELYVYFDVEGERASSAELEELAHDAGAADLPSNAESQVVARLSPESKVSEGEQAELVFHPDRLHLFDADSGKRLTA